MSFFGPSFFQISYENPFFVAAALAACLLAVLAVLFVMAAIALRIVGDRRRAQRERLEAEWEPMLLEALAGQRAPAAVQERIRKDKRLAFLNFTYRFARRVQGQDLAVLRKIAQPFLADLAARAASKFSASSAFANTSIK